MRYQGKITIWKDEKGFGFVTTNASGEKAFVHIKSFSRRSKRPVEGDKITYELKMDENNRMRAENIQFVGEQSASTSSPKSKLIENTLMKKLLFVVVALCIGYMFFNGPPIFTSSEAPSSISEQSTYENEALPSIAEQSTFESDAIIANAFSNHQSNLQISGQGVVTELLTDDNSGIRHQKFIISLTSGQTLLVSHNIDLAPKISSLRRGDSVQFYGEYEWNEKGGVLHWTHRDPKGSHVAGWLQHQGQRYQ